MSAFFLSMLNRAGIKVEGGDNSGDISTQVLISLFTDARADIEDMLPDGSKDLRGWPGDTFSSRPWGSKLWLLYREKMTTEVRNKAVKYAQEALAWMTVDDGYGALAKSVVVTGSIPQFQVLALSIMVTKPSGDEITLTVSKRWETQSAS